VNLAGAATYALTADLAGELAAVRSSGICSAVLWGERDRLLPLAYGQALAARLGARMQVIPGADHDWPLRDPQGLADAIEAAVCGAFDDETCGKSEAA
jgi:pimeloyl-ACP methyl ester carboxylesterase